MIALRESSEWSGMLPPPDEFNKYVPAVQARMMGWNDAWTTDESARQDKLVQAEVDNAKAGPNRAMTILILFAVPAVVFFAKGNEVAGFAFLGVPVFTFATNLIASVASRSSRPPGPGSGS